MGQSFQSTHPRRVRRCPDVFKNTDLQFQSTHPRRVRLKEGDHCRFCKAFQSTHPRRVRLEAVEELKPVMEISIHAPTKGATGLLKTCRNFQIHFNPRTHEGCDCTRSYPSTRLLTISIHAPTKGATS